MRPINYILKFSIKLNILKIIHLILLLTWDLFLIGYFPNLSELVNYLRDGDIVCLLIVHMQNLVPLEFYLPLNKIL